MKQVFLIFICTLLFPNISFSQPRKVEKPVLTLPSAKEEGSFAPVELTTLETCWGIPFGTKKDSVKNIVRSKTKKLPASNPDPDVLVYNNCYFGGNIADVITLLFVDNLFYGVSVKFKPERDPNILNLYGNVKGDISSKYFIPQQDVESYKYPFSKGDEDSYLAIKGGYATIGAIWQFKRSEKTRGAGMIVLSVNSDASLSLQYRDGFLSELAKIDIDKEVKADY